MGSRSQVVRVPGRLIAPAARLLGLALRDTLGRGYANELTRHFR